MDKFIHHYSILKYLEKVNSKVSRDQGSKSRYISVKRMAVNYIPATLCSNA